MYKVFAADIRRLLKSKLFYSLNIIWIVVYGLMFVLIFGLLDKFVGVNAMYAEDVFMQEISLIPLMSGIFVGSYIGEEFRDGTIRNKIIRGTGRLEMYASAICYTVITSLVTQITILLTSLLFGYSFFDGCLNIKELMIRSGIYTLGGTAVVIFFTGLVYIMTSAKASNVVCPSLTIVSFFVTIYVEQKLYPQSGICTLSDGVKNVFLFIDKYIPFSYFYSDQMYDVKCYIIGSLGFALIGILMGAAVFNKKDLK